MLPWGPAGLFPHNHGAGRKLCFQLRNAEATSGEWFTLSLFLLFGYLIRPLPLNYMPGSGDSVMMSA